MTLNMEYFLLASTPGWPLLIAVLLALPGLRDRALYLVPFAAVPALLCVLLTSPDPELSLPWLLLGSNLGMDQISRVFLLSLAILWTVGSIMLPTIRRSYFCIWFLITMAGSFTVLLAQDIPLFFLSYAVMSLASFGLIIHEHTPEALRAAKVYIVFAVLGEIVLLTAFLMVAHNAGTLELEHIVDRTPQDLLIALLMVGFGIKAGLPLLHLALPPVYASAPLASVVPMAGGLLHLGLYGWMRFLPLGQVALPDWSSAFVAIGAFAVFFGVIVGLTQQQARSLLAYSSISQTGLMTLAIGIGLGSPEQWPLVQSVLLLFAFHHALSKGALFLGLGIPGIGRLGLWLPALTLAGVPFTGGALGKGMLKAQAYLLPELWSSFSVWVVTMSSMVTTLLMARFLFLALSKKSHPEPGATIFWWPLLSGLLLLPWIWPLPLAQYSSSWASVWAILLASAAAWLVYRGLFARILSFIPTLPPGDLLVLAEKLVQKIHHSPGQSSHSSNRQEHDAPFQPLMMPIWITVVEHFLGRWQIAITLLLLVLLGIFWLLALG